jgi:anti-sigma factor RsiW
MDHQEAVRCEAVEKYLLDELTPAERAEFEQHFFDCHECALDLRAAAAFLDAAKKELAQERAARPAPDPPKASWFAFLWRPAFVAPAFALLLGIVVYQSAVVYPRLTGEIAHLRRPEILSPVSLIDGNSRGGALSSVTVSKDHSVLLSVDIPTVGGLSSYSCVLMAPSGSVVWRLPVSAERAKDTVSIRIPAGDWQRGVYTLVIQGSAASELARYRFSLNSSD